MIHYIQVQRTLPSAFGITMTEQLILSSGHAHKAAVCSIHCTAKIIGKHILFKLQLTHSICESSICRIMQQLCHRSPLSCYYPFVLYLSNGICIAAVATKPRILLQKLVLQNLTPLTVPQNFLFQFCTIPSLCRLDFLLLQMSYQILLGTQTGFVVFPLVTTLSNLFIQLCLVLLHCMQNRLGLASRCTGQALCQRILQCLRCHKILMKFCQLPCGFFMLCTHVVQLFLQNLHISNSLPALCRCLLTFLAFFVGLFAASAQLPADLY
ncbi:membrane protein [gut metagenome]|uniref:Membrane protein n=1 Tax=gut metagenome TaxID=749906 RepID=J9GSU9_9ZZZZ